LTLTARLTERAGEVSCKAHAHGDTVFGFVMTPRTRDPRAN
jgi:hypothetical protein